MSEHDAYQSLRKGIRQPGDRINRIENIVGNGFPDTNICLSPGIESWVELKAPREPKRASLPLIGKRNHPLSVDQRNWALSQLRAGGRAFIYVETDKRRLLIHSKHADAFNDMTVEQLRAVALWESTRRTMQHEWNNLRAILASQFV